MTAGQIKGYYKPKIRELDKRYSLRVFRSKVARCIVLHWETGTPVAQYTDT